MHEVETFGKVDSKHRGKSFLRESAKTDKKIRFVCDERYVITY